MQRILTAKKLKLDIYSSIFLNFFKADLLGAHTDHSVFILQVGQTQIKFTSPTCKYTFENTHFPITHLGDTGSLKCQGQVFLFAKVLTDI